MEKNIYTDIDDIDFPESSMTNKKKQIKNIIYTGLMFLFGIVFVVCMALIVVWLAKHYFTKYTVPKDTLTESEYVVSTESAQSPDLGNYVDEPIGVLYYEKCGLQTTLKYSNKQEICDEKNVATVIPTYYGTSAIGEPGYALIGDHNYQDFGNLAYASIGDKVYIKTFYGEFLYEVKDMVYGTYETDGDTSGIILDNEESVKDFCANTEEQGIVLYTCYPFDANKTDRRYVVICQQIEGTAIN